MQGGATSVPYTGEKRPVIHTERSDALKVVRGRNKSAKTGAIHTHIVVKDKTLKPTSKIQKCST